MDLSSLTSLLLTLIEAILRDMGIPGLFALMVVESFGVPPLPSEVILPLAGFLVWEGAVGLGGIPFTWTTVVVSAVVGGLVGAFCAYYVGQVLGIAVIHRAGSRLGLSHRDLVRAERFFQRRGPVTVCLARLLPVMRAYISYPAGAARMDPGRFALYTVIGSTPFTIALVYAGFLLRQNLGVLVGLFNILDVVGAAILVALLVLFWRHRLTRNPDQGRNHSPGAPPPDEGPAPGNSPPPSS